MFRMIFSNSRSSYINFFALTILVCQLLQSSWWIKFMFGMMMATSSKLLRGTIPTPVHDRKVKVTGLQIVNHPPSVRTTFVLYLFSLSHLLRDHWSDVFETCMRCSPSSLVVQARQQFRSVYKYGQRQPFSIFTVIASPSKSQEEICRNFAYEFLSMPRCVSPKTFLVR